jgi:hypothetical protein
MTDVTMGLQFECDQLNKISLIRVEGLLTDKSLGILYESNRRHCAVTAALVGIVDLSSVSEFALTNSFIQQLANQMPLIAEAKRSCIIVALEDYAFGLCRMFQLMGEGKTPTAANCSHHGRGVCGNRHSVPALRVFGPRHR